MSKSLFIRKPWAYFTNSIVTNNLQVSGARNVKGEGVGGVRDGNEIGVEDPESEEI